MYLEDLVKKILFIGAVIFVISLSWKTYDTIVGAGSESFAEKEARAGEKIEEVFREQNVKMGECRVEALYFYGAMYLNDDEEYEIVRETAKELGIVTDCNIEKIKTDNGHKLELIKEGRRSKVIIDFMTVEIHEANNLVSIRHYIEIKIELKSSIRDGIFYKSRVESILNGLKDKNNDWSENILTDKFEDNSEDNSGGTPENNPEYSFEAGEEKTLSLMISGSIYGKMDEKLEKSLARQIFKELDVNTVFEHSDENGYSIYGYTENFQEYMTVGFDKINLNVAYSYDEEKNITTIYIALPIIDYDY